MHDGCRCGDKPVILSTFWFHIYHFQQLLASSVGDISRSDIEMACISAMKKVSPILDTFVFLVLCCAYYIDVPNYIFL